MIIEHDNIRYCYRLVYDLQPYSIAFPIFQRGYCWKENEAERILTDITSMLDDETIDEKDIYLFDFIGYEENEMLKLADGQQRLITIYVLIKCLQEYAESIGMPLAIDNFDISYEDVKLQKKWSSFNEGKICSPFKAVYIRMRHYVEEHPDNVDAIADIIMNKIHVLMKLASNADDAFDIFEQVNAGGKPLSKDEIISTIIKQYSYKYGIDLGVSGNKLKDVLVSYYKYSLSGRQGKFDNFAIMSFLNQYVVTSRETFIEFKNYIDMISTISDSPILFVANLLKRGQLVDMIYAYEVKGKSLLNHKSTVDDVLLPMFLLSAIFTLRGISPAGRVKQFFDKALEKVKANESDDNIKQYILSFADANKDICMISVSELASCMQGKNRQRVLEAILLMDILYRNTSGSFVPASINLEHVYPQKPDIEWAMRGWPISEDEQELYIYSIGNCLILNERINKKIQNAYLTKKRPAYEAIFNNDRVLQTDMNSIDYEAIEARQKSYIDDRRYSIAQQIQESMPCGRVFVINDYS